MAEAATETTTEPNPEQAGPSLAAEIRERRRRLGWTQREVAAHLGVRRELVARWEGGHPVSGPYWPDLEAILRIRVDPHAPGGWVDADADRAARAAARVVNVVVVVATPAKAAEILRGLGARADAVEVADADEIVRRLGVTPT